MHESINASRDDTPRIRPESPMQPAMRRRAPYARLMTFGMRTTTEPPRKKETAMDAIQLLKKDHVTVRGLLDELETTTPRGLKKRTELIARIARELKAHTTIEEEIFYPAFKAAARKGDDSKMFFEATEEHRAAGDLVLPDVLSTDPRSEKFSGRAKVLKEMIEHHAKEEEKDMFPRAKELLSKEELLALGDQMAARKQQLLAANGRMPG